MSDNNCWRGRTEATLEGLAKSVDYVIARMDKLPCSEHVKLIAANKKSTSIGLKM